MNERVMHGRKVIRLDAVAVTNENVVSLVNKAFETHTTNRADIDYLWNYYKGKQPILNRIKQVRPEICNKIVENRANEIVSFKVGYLCGEPIQYVSRSADESVSKGISLLNEMMECEDKAAKDKEVVEWQMICGTAYRLFAARKIWTEDDAPFKLTTLDPRNTFVVYSNDVDETLLLGITYYINDDNKRVCSVYSADHFWVIEEDKVISSMAHTMGGVPIFEYPANNARLGSFEIVLPLLDELNNLASNRMDGVEQFVQSFIKFINCDISAEDFANLREQGGIKVKSDNGNPADVDIVANELKQGDTQTIVDYTYKTILTICGMPSMSDGSTSDSSNNGAVVLKNGWQGAETRAKDSELMFKKSESQMLRLLLNYLRTVQYDVADIANLRLRDIVLKFTRRNYENIMAKSQVLTTMLNNDKIHPRLAFEQSGMFPDPEEAYRISYEYYMKNKDESELVKTQMGDNPTETEE